MREGHCTRASPWICEEAVCIFILMTNWSQKATSLNRSFLSVKIYNCFLLVIYISCLTIIFEKKLLVKFQKAYDL